MTYLKSPGRQSRDFMHQEPKPRHRKQKKPFEVFCFPQTAINFTHHLCDVAVQIFALNKDVSNLTIYFPWVIWLAIGCLTDALRVSLRSNFSSSSPALRVQPDWSSDEDH